MLRVMQINQGELFGGVSAMMLHYYEHIDHNLYQYDFVAPRNSSLAQRRKEIERNGGAVIELGADGNLFVRKIKFWHRLKTLIKKNGYKIVHINSGSILFNVQCAWIAKQCHVNKIIVHSHNAGTDGTLKQRVMQHSRFLLDFTATDFWACSRRAAEYMFTEKRFKSGRYRVINNGIETQKFRFCPETRAAYRKELGIENRKVLLHVGRFSQQKNHRFLIDVFREFYVKHPEAVLLLVGEGELLEPVMQYVGELGIQEQVKHLGLRQDIPELMMAADIFILPSLYEGLPVVGIEAQASGLPCVFSDQITREVDLLGRSSFVSLNVKLENWCQSIETALHNTYNRSTCADKVAENGYDIEMNAREMEKLYTE